MDWFWVLVIIIIVGIIWLSSVYEDRNTWKSTAENRAREMQDLLSKEAEWEQKESQYHLAISDALSTSKVKERENFEKEAALDFREKEIKESEELFYQLFRERTKNFPVIGQIWSDLIDITESERERALKFKKRPALSAASEVAAIKREKRELVKELVGWKYRAQNYEAIYPWLTEELEEEIETQIAEDLYYTVYTPEEREDPISTFLSPEDYRNLSPSAKSQLALDRYWTRGKKSKWMVGKMYERYVGHLYEKDGWKVEYFGIHKKFEDLGRDLIAIKGNDVHIIQCKNWAHFKSIYENAIFQLFGTAYSMRDDFKGKNVKAVFYTTTKLSETAQKFSELLGIEVNANHKLEPYAAIKCNISPNGDKIYHLPFDQQYDNIKITPRTGEFYALTVSEAENAGFRHALRWKGQRP